MFTVEHEYDSTVIISLDETDSYNDIEVIVGDNGGVYIRQFDDDLNQYEMVYCSFQQLLDILAAINTSEGMHFIKVERRQDDSRG
jgi:exosome complex RNA-binding protein Rrp4